MTRIDLNCDMGESFGAWTMGNDPQVMRSITSANVACGYHGGDPQVMRQTVRLARQHGVAVGAHPGLPDLVGFGRRDMNVSACELEDMMLYQIGALAAIARAEGVRLQHVKAHGALYNMTSRDPELAAAIARAVAAFDKDLILLGLPGSALVRAGDDAGLRTASEAFADRAYDPDGSLTSRRKPGSVIHDPDTVVARALRMVQESGVVATDGSWVPLKIDTICTHGDTPGAHDLVQRLRAAFESHGIAVTPMGAAT
jgi:UPF0271 protein